MATFIRKPPAYQGGSDNVLKAIDSGLDNLAHALTLGDTWVLGPTMVNSIRVAYNRTTVQRYNTPYFSPTDLGIKLHPYIRGCDADPGPARIRVAGRHDDQRSSGTTSTRWPMT